MKYGNLYKNGFSRSEMISAKKKKINSVAIAVISFLGMFLDDTNGLVTRLSFVCS
jgi:hypothetical protein